MLISILNVGINLCCVNQFVVECGLYCLCSCFLSSSSFRTMAPGIWHHKNQRFSIAFQVELYSVSEVVLTLPDRFTSTANDIKPIILAHLNQTNQKLQLVLL